MSIPANDKEVLLKFLPNKNYFNLQSNLCTTATFGTPKKRPLFRGGHYSEVTPIKIVLLWDVWGSGWPLLTGGRCSEVAISTGLTVFLNLKSVFCNKGIIFFL